MTMTIQKQRSSTMSLEDSGPPAATRIRVNVCEPSPPSVGSSEIQMQLLSAPALDSELGMMVDEESGVAKPRRYSTNTPGSHHQSKSNLVMSPNVRRRRSLASIKWSSIARRFSMGISHTDAEETNRAVSEVNYYVAQFRDSLIHIGQSKDRPEMREKVRRIRRSCIESCRQAVHLLLQQIRSDVTEEIPVDYSPQLVLLFFCTQLLLRELKKCRRLVMALPMDMTNYYADQRPGPSNLGGVLSQIILCRQINPDFNSEELCSVDKDTSDILDLLNEMQEFMPKENTQQPLTLAQDDMLSKWARRRRKHPLYRRFGSLCCGAKPPRPSPNPNL